MNKANQLSEFHEAGLREVMEMRWLKWMARQQLGVEGKKERDSKEEGQSWRLNRMATNDDHTSMQTERTNAGTLQETFMKVGTIEVNLF